MILGGTGNDKDDKDDTHRILLDHPRLAGLNAQAAVHDEAHQPHPGPVVALALRTLVGEFVGDTAQVELGSQPGSRAKRLAFPLRTSTAPVLGGSESRGLRDSETDRKAMPV